MRRNWVYGGNCHLMAVLFALVCGACSSDPFNSEDWGSGSESSGAGGTVNGGSSSAGTTTGSLLSFTIAADAISDEDAATADLAIDKTGDYAEDYEAETLTSVVSVVYKGTTATVTGLTSSLGTLGSTEGSSDVVLNLTAKNIRLQLSGTTSAGSLKVYSEKKYVVELQDGLSMVAGAGPCLNLQSSKRAYIVISGTSSLTDAETYATSTEDQKGCIFAEGKLIFSGTGTLTVNGKSKHAICSDDYVHIYDGNIVVAGALKDAIHANDLFFMEGGSLTVAAAGSNGVECEEGPIVLNGGTLNITSENDAISASYEGTDTSITPTITIGGGLVKVNTTGEKAMGLKCEGNFTMTGGVVKANVTGAGSKGISSNGNLTISGGKVLALTSGTAYVDTSTTIDVKGAAGLKADGTLTIGNATVLVKSTGKGGKGISCDGVMTINDGAIVDVITTGAIYTYGSSGSMGGNSSSDYDSSPKGIRCESDLVINGGTIRVMATGGEGSEGVESKANLTINGGTLLISTYDDAINASKSITINGGNVYAYASNNDGVDSNGTLTITGGLVVASGTTSPEEGFDCDQNAFKVSGGTFIGIGGSTSSPTSLSQSVLKYAGAGSGGAIFTVASSDGTVIGSYVIPRTYSSMTILFSSSALKSGTTYTVYSGGTITGNENSTFYGLSTAGSVSGGTSLGTFTASSSSMSQMGSSSGNGGMGGWGH